MVRILSMIALSLGRPARRALLLALAGVALLLSPAAGAASEKRVALVIGNGAYRNAPRLDNAVLDATAVADALRKLGFDVTEGMDLDIAGMRAKVAEFSQKLPGAQSALVYYAGHGVSVDEENYLIPTDIALKSPTDLDLGAISVSLVLRQMKRDERVNVVILDACRDNPFAEALARSRTRSIVGERGLSRIDGDLARGTLIAFASDPKSAALDGAPGEHSPFTAAFLRHVFDPGASIDVVMSRVRTEVWETTRHGQLPWVNTSLIGDWVLDPQPAPQAAEAAKAAAPPSFPEPRSREDLLWESAQHSNLRGDYQAYLEAFPGGFFAQMAKNRIAALDIPGAARSEPAPAKGPETKDWKAEAGTAETEKALGLTPDGEREIQQRLAALGLYNGPATGALDAATRLAIAAWQTRGGAAPSSYLGPMQLAELRRESEDAYQKLLAGPTAPEPKAAAGPAPTPHAATRRAAIREPARELGTRERAAPEPVKPPRPHLARRASPPPAAEAQFAAPAALPRCNGNPIWCRHAGLPVDSPYRVGRPLNY